MSDTLPLPVEGHIAAAAIAAERLRIAAENVGLMLQLTPRDGNAVATAFTAVLAELRQAWRSYDAYEAVRSCDGQA